MKSWMIHIKLPKKMFNRVVRYQTSLWKKFKGIDNNEILNELPSTMKNDLLLNLLKAFIFLL